MVRKDLFLCQESGVIKYLSILGDEAMQMYGDFEGFPEDNSALFGFVSYNDPGWFQVQ